MITYRNAGSNGLPYSIAVVVYLDGRRIGTIKHVPNGFAYFPIGQHSPGETLPTIDGIKRTLEEM